jgi:hypothetical protein
MARWSEGDEHVLARGDRSRRGGARAKSATEKSATEKSATPDSKTEHKDEG